MISASLSIAATYCGAYPDELREIGNTREQIIADITDQAETLKRLNYRLLDNFLDL